MDEFQEKVKDIQERVKAHVLVLNRVPKNIREEFVKYAEEEFCDDYGMALKYVWDHFKLWKMFFENMDYKLDELLRKVNNLTEERPEEKDSLSMLSGRRIAEKGGKKQNGKFK